MVGFKTIDDLDVNDKVVFVRADLNVPYKDGKVTDTTRIDRFAPTVKDLLAKGAKVVIASHLGRPDGQVIPEMSLKVVVPDLEKAIGKPIKLLNECIGPEVNEAVENMQQGEVILLENLRFHAEEEENDSSFSRSLASNMDIYIDDAFSTSHRAHASTEGMAKLLPNGAGRLMEEELNALDKALGNPVRPVMAIVGGAKVSTKIDLLGNLVTKVDKLVIGGGMANTFLFAQGVDIGKSLCEKDMADTARSIMAKAKDKGCEIVLPVDVVVADEFKDGVSSETISVSSVPADKMILDIGSESVKTVIAKMAGCKTLIWNGPVGAFEVSPFNEGTNRIAAEVVKLTSAGSLLSVAGGGDTVSALKKAKALEGLSYVSTAGGAFLEWMEGKTLPGVAALMS